HVVRGVVGVKRRVVGAVALVDVGEEVVVHQRLQRYPPPLAVLVDPLLYELARDARAGLRAQAEAQQVDPLLDDAERPGLAFDLVVRPRVHAIELLDRLQVRRVGFIVRRERARHHETRYGARREGADAAEDAHGLAGVDGVVPRALGLDRVLV